MEKEGKRVFSQFLLWNRTWTCKSHCKMCPDPSQWWYGLIVVSFTHLGSANTMTQLTSISVPSSQVIWALERRKPSEYSLSFLHLLFTCSFLLRVVIELCYHPGIDLTWLPMASCLNSKSSSHLTVKIHSCYDGREMKKPMVKISLDLFILN